MPLDVEELIRDIKSAYKRLNAIDEPYPPYKCVHPHKSTKSAQLFYLFGNNLESMTGRSLEALWSYTLSIANAPDDSRESYLSYYKRALLFSKLSDPESGILDVNRCLKGSRDDEPDSLLPIEMVKNMCIRDLNDSSIGTNTEVYDDWNNFNVDEKPRWHKRLLKQFKNPLLPNASVKIELAYSEKRGRHIVAADSIVPGEVLITEDCYVASAQGGAGMYCDYCLVMCYGLIPCQLCTVAMYCSDWCRKCAYDSYHRLECQLLRNAYCGYTMADATAVRMFLVGTHRGALLPNLIKYLSIPGILEENLNFAGKIFHEDYLTVLALLAGPVDSAFLKSRVEDACKIISLLYEMDFFQYVAENKLEYAKIFSAALLLNNYAVQRQNELNVISCTTRVHRETRGLCDGLMLVLSMLNHSCYPNVAIYRHRRECVMYALRPIKKAEPIVYGFCDSFENAPIETRHKQLNFTCHCVACTHFWPPFLKSGLLHQQPDSRALKVLYGDLGVPMKSKYYPLLVELAVLASFILEDKLLKNYEISQILQIITRMNSILHKFMKPTAFPVFQIRQLFVTFMEIYFEQLEFDFNSCSFPDCLQTTNYDVPEDFTLENVYLFAMDRLCKVIRKLHVLTSQEEFIYKYDWNNCYLKSYRT